MVMEMVRDGRIVWPTCSECGCRIFYHKLWGMEYLAHKLKDINTDAGGHKCDALHEYWPITENIRDRVLESIGEN